MGYWSILKPLAGQNLIPNSSFEVDESLYNLLSSWTGSAATIFYPSNPYTYKGAWSCEIDPTANTFAGMYYTTPVLLAGDYTFSAYVWGANTVPYRVRFANTSGTTVGTATTFTGNGGWQRVSVTATLTNAAHRLYIEKNNSASTALFYVDAVQLETGSTATTYIDGWQSGCTWDGPADLSTSSRTVESGGGGEWIDFDDLGITVLDMAGVGMPPIDNIATPYALLPGAQYQRSIARTRALTLTCLVSGSTWADLHVLRNLLVERVQPGSGTNAPIQLRYTGSATPQTISAYYDGGLEFGKTSGFYEIVPLRFVAHDPFWYAEQDQYNGTGGSSFSAAGSVMLRPDGEWIEFDSRLTSGYIYCAVRDIDNTIIVGGDFTDAGGIVGADYLARYNPVTDTWSAMGTFNGIVRDIILDPFTYNSYYAVGDFTTIDGGTARRIAVGSGAGTWGELGNANAAVNSVIATTNYLVVTGSFTTIDGVTRTRIARYDLNAGTWGSIGTGLNGTGNDLVVDPAVTDAFWVGGAFTTAAGATVNRVARYPGTGSTFTAMGSTGVSSTVNAMGLTSANVLYVGGAFTTAGGVSSPYLAAWNGTGWQAVPTGPLSSVTALAISNNDEVIAACDNGFTPLINPDPGIFSQARVARYTQGAWLPMYNGLVEGSTFNFVWADNQYVIVTSTVTVSVDYGQPVVVTNNGTAPAAIVLPYAQQLYHFNAQQGVWIITGTITDTIADLRNNRVRIFDRTSGANRIKLLVPGSQPALTVLQPGDNRIAGYASDVVFWWTPRNWSLDA